MDKRLLAFMATSMFLAVILGYAAGYLTLRKNVTTLTADLKGTWTNLEATQTELSAKNTEVETLKAEAIAQTQRVDDLTKQFKDLREAFTGEANQTIAQLTNELHNTTEALRLADNELSAMKERHITLRASGTGTINDLGVEVRTNRTLTIELGWTQGGWSGYGFYTVIAAQNDTSIDLEAGYVYILEVIKFNNVTITGGNLNAQGIIYKSDRANLVIENDVQVNSTPRSGGGDDVFINWPSLNSTVTLSGTIIIKGI